MTRRHAIIIAALLAVVQPLQAQTTAPVTPTSVDVHIMPAVGDPLALNILPVATRKNCARVFATPAEGMEVLTKFPSIRLAMTEAEREPNANEIVAWFEENK